jgi:hypothetical protein
MTSTSFPILSAGDLTAAWAIQLTRKATHTKLYYHPTYKHFVLYNFSHRARDICDHAEMDSLETCRQMVTTAAISVISSILLRK